jgi:hypothetical protein
MLEQIRAAWALGTPSRPLAVMFGITSTELSHLVRLHGWQTRAECFWAVGKSAAERAAEIRAAEAAHELSLYGDQAAIDDVRLLRRRGFVVVRESQRCRVGNMLCSLAALRVKAARERRLIGPAQASAGAEAKSHALRQYQTRGVIRAAVRISAICVPTA